MRPNTIMAIGGLPDVDFDFTFYRKNKAILPRWHPSSQWYTWHIQRKGKKKKRRKQ